MNICLLMGEICSAIQFDFILNSKDISIAKFNVKLLDGSSIRVKAYNELADYCYRNLEKGMLVQIEGYINSKCEVIVSNINIFNSKLGDNSEI